ncbi:hypothetical protein MC885_015839, partial [Smutsia gigantea]
MSWTLQSHRFRVLSRVSWWAECRGCRAQRQVVLTNELATYKITTSEISSHRLRSLCISHRRRLLSQRSSLETLEDIEENAPLRRIVLISGRRSFCSIFSVLPYRDSAQAGYVYACLLVVLWG